MPAHLVAIAASSQDTPPPLQSACQADSLCAAASSSVPYIVELAQRALEQTRRHGLLAAIMKAGRFVTHRARPHASSQPTARPTPVMDGELLNLQPGEVVEVKSEAEIAATLDSVGSLKGLMFLPAMKAFCGQRFVVLKRLERMYQEESGTLRRLKNTVLLDRVMCDGLLMRCDRCCFFYWREAWLRRVPNITDQS